MDMNIDEAVTDFMKDRSDQKYFPHYGLKCSKLSSRMELNERTRVASSW